MYFINREMRIVELNFDISINMSSYVFHVNFISLSPLSAPGHLKIICSLLSSQPFIYILYIYYNIDNIVHKIC